jgi:hypothetical protein
MTAQFPAQRRAADEFARLVDGPARPVADLELAPLLRTVTLLREQPRPVPRPAFVTDLRERLLAAADEALAPVAGAVDAGRSRTRRPLRWRERHLGAVAAALVMVGSTAGLAAASQGSLPGDTLYPLKRGIEHVEVAMSTNDAAKGKELLSQASTRLQEVQALVRKDNHDAKSEALIGETLQDFRSSADKGSDLLFKTYQGNNDSKDIADVRDFTTGTMATLQSLVTQSPATTTDDFSQAGETVADIDQQARVLCVACSDAQPVTLPQALVNLTSARSLETFLTLPAKQAAQASDLAKKAEQTAKDPQVTATPSGSASPSGVPSLGSNNGNTGSGGLAGALPSPGSHPLTDLVEGLTSRVPVVGTVTQGLGDSLKGITDPLGQTAEGLSQSLSGLLGGSSPSATPQK